MSIWSRLKESITGNESSTTIQGKVVARDTSRYAFVDIEVGLKNKKICDIGALKMTSALFHSNNKKELLAFLEDVDYLCGHNIIHHDATYLFGEEKHKWKLVDTLYISPILFPEHPYHRLVKDEKLQSDEFNNPINDCKKAEELFLDEVNQWYNLPKQKQIIYATLLKGIEEFDGFLEMVQATTTDEDLSTIIKEVYEGKICSNANLHDLIAKFPCETAFALSLIDTTNRRSTTPPWVLLHYPNVETVMRKLRHNQCEGCAYCQKKLNIHYNLKKYFGYEHFRTYNGLSLQENAVNAAVKGNSLLAIFPTGGGKSLTFQLPALMEGDTIHGLTVVISPLQSLMKDQVDTLTNRGLTDAVTINGLLDPISRANAIEQVQSGTTSILYIAPEMLRSNTIERLLLSRHVIRFVIDEAHCFSSWGQDFRVDYLYIGKFIKRYQEKKKSSRPIPISCFTATAKPKVIQDITNYFKHTLGIDLQIFNSTATRNNLHYSVLRVESEDEKYQLLRSLIETTSCPTIIYVSRTKRTFELSEKLNRDGHKALPFNGKMEADQKIKNQDAFMNDNVRIIVATSAFGMGVDKSDVGLVIHYDISDSLENYIQEAGRAGRNPQLEAKCFILFDEQDLDKHFILLNQTKLNFNEIQQVWKAIKDITKYRTHIQASALEIARKAGWDDSVSDIETRVRSALSALEQSGYIERGNNIPHLYATGITIKNLDEARLRLTQSVLFEKNEIENTIRIIRSLLSQKAISKAQNGEGETRIDYLSDTLGIPKANLISIVERMRQEKILADSKDISAYLQDAGDSENKAKRLLERFIKLEQYILQQSTNQSIHISCKQLNSNAQNAGISTATEKDIRTILNFLTIKGYTKKREDAEHNVEVEWLHNAESSLQRLEKRFNICQFTINWLYKLLQTTQNQETNNNAVNFSIIELLNDYKKQNTNLFYNTNDTQIYDIEEALLYLSKIEALKLEGGFLVLYNAMDIQRIKDNKLRYKQEDYKMLDDFYKLKIQQIHIAGEYANLMSNGHLKEADQFVKDYFQLEYKKFIAKYFSSDRIREIQRNITPQKYNSVMKELSAKQMEIITDKESRCIVVAAGPGSGKTRVLVHKLASLLLLEDVKHEQLLMLTFSRAASIEFKQRLMQLIGNAAHFVEIKTFHSYSFDLLGRIGNIEEVKNVVGQAAKMIREGDVETNRIRKTVLVIDEAQDMSTEEYELVCALMSANEDMRVIAVGDDDQNIYEFRGSDSSNMRQLLTFEGSRFIEMTENYRSTKHIVHFANNFANNIPNRMKSTPILSMSHDNGWVSISRHSSEFLYQPLAKDIMSQAKNGSVGILTQTNEEAVILVALLRKQGLNCKLIQSMEGFHFWNMAEVRLFLKHIEKNLHSPLIKEEVWQEAKRKTFEFYSTSKALPYLQQCISIFEKNYEKKYLTDFKDFVYESSVEDFCDIRKNDIIVSTIHKSKGKEFDDVYLFISASNQLPTDQMRKYYVGITRAKQRLFIHTNSTFFDRYTTDYRTSDIIQYDMPTEVVLQLSHKDVHLGFFKPIKNLILSLRSGEKLIYKEDTFYETRTHQAVAKLSQKMHNELTNWAEKKYYVFDATIRFIVAWKPADAPREENETAVLLIDLLLKR